MKFTAIAFTYVIQTVFLITRTHSSDNTTMCGTESSNYDPLKDNDTEKTIQIDNNTEGIENFYPVYPNFRCFEGYNRNSNESGGEDILKGFNENCTAEVQANSSKVCFKQCMMVKLGVLSSGSYELNDNLTMADILEMVISFNTKSSSGRKIANRIILSCEGKYDAVKFRPCGEWTEFYNCVDEAWKCTEYRNKFRNRTYRRHVHNPPHCYVKVMRK